MAEVFSYVPRATYRWQFNYLFTFQQAAELADYIAALGISDCYASPLMTARRGSLHGYDVTDHKRLNPELGGEAGFEAFAAQLKAHGLGLVLDVVPNHMCVQLSVGGAGNRWWEDVLEEGPASPYARFFDIDWHPPKTNLHNKILLPILGQQYGDALEAQELKLTYKRGKFSLNYYETTLPIAPETAAPLLQLVADAVRAELGEAHPRLLELESIIRGLEHLPPRGNLDTDQAKARRGEKEVLKQRLAALVSGSREVKRALAAALHRYNGTPGDAQSFDALEALLARQSYRLSYWRVAADEINYRRFFDVNELAAIRVEETKVFTEVHELVFELIRAGAVRGLRIDHVDGLFNPAAYLKDLQRGCARALRQARGESKTGRLSRAQLEASDKCYVVVEKILEGEERLRPNWACAGTTGYEFLNLLNGVFVETSNARLFQRLYERFTGLRVNFKDVVYESKKLILRVSMSSELTVLARQLDRISEQDRATRDFTLNSLTDALGELVACFPVYRTYVTAEGNAANEDDQRYIATALREAKRRNPALSPSLFDFIRAVLLGADPPKLTEKQRADRRRFAMKFQQLTGPVMAKGVEDTAFYRYFPLASLNEVGGDPAHFGHRLATFHRMNEERAAAWPHTLLATSTHDTKRSEDVRARLNVLSEIPGRWYRAARRWQQLNAPRLRRDDHLLYPNEEYLLYQTLIGTWPLGAQADSGNDEYTRRIQEYMIKALREAKVHSSWLNPNEPYEAAIKEMIAELLTPGGDFLRDLIEFQKPIARAGMFNSLAQTLLKITAPGVPDFYQGSETWDFSLVDPDNRRPVDYAARRRMLAELNHDFAEMLNSLEDGRIKLFLTSRALRLRAERPELFARGDYLPLQTTGERGDQVIAFARRHGEQSLIVATGRFFTRLDVGARLPIGAEVWSDTRIELPEQLAGCYRELLTDYSLCVEGPGEQNGLPVAEVFAQFPFALLERVR